MKRNSPLLRSIGAVLALLMFAALPSSLAGLCAHPCDPTCDFYYGIGDWTTNTEELETTYPSNAWIFYTKTVGTANNNDPCHDASGTPCPYSQTGYYTYKVINGARVGLAYGITYLRMVAWRSDLGDSSVVACDQQNPP